MASPFQFFHKYQKAFIAIAAVMAMFIFVVADPLMSYLSSSGGGQSAKTVVASWDGGSIDMQELNRLTERRFKVSLFLDGLYGQASNTVIAEGGEPLPPAVLPSFILPRNSTQTSVRQNCVQDRLLADLAEKSGISISDKFINHYLTEWGLRRMGDTEITALLKRARLSDRALFAGLRELLLGKQYQDSFALAVAGITPEERWEDWQRINESIKVEAAILPARDFVAQVPTPSEAELKKFYEDNKDRFQKTMDVVVGKNLPSPKPGFKIPRLVKIQYLSGNVEDRVQKLEDSITDEEIAAYYEENKHLFVKTNAALEDNENIFGDDEETAEDSESDAEAETTEGDAATEETATEESSTETSATEESSEVEMTEEASSSKSETTEAEDEATETEAAASEEATEKVEEATDAATDAAEEASEEAAPPADNTSSRNARRSPFRLAAFQNEAETEAAEGEEASTVETSTEEADAEEAAEETAEGDAETETAAAEETADDETDEATDAEVTEEEAAPVEYTPLAEVSKDIRKTLARKKATIAVRKAIDKANAKLQKLYKPYGFKVVTARSEDKEAPATPATLKDYTELAKELDLTLTMTVPLSYSGVIDTDIGKTVDDQSGRRRVFQLLFTDLKPYQPLLAKDYIPQEYEQFLEDSRKYFIVCKTQDIEARVPEFKKIRAEVLTAWKNKEAGKLALAKAKELAKQAQESGDTIAVVARGQNIAVETSNMFSWFTFGNVSPNQAPRNYQLGSAEPLKALDDDFMTQAFGLEANQKVALLNHDHSEAYVIQVSERAQTKQELRERFLLEGDRWFGRRAMDTSRRRKAGQRIQTKLFEEVNFNDDKLTEILSSNAN